ncbi:MAG TPA: hypothetical protein IAB38_03250 [Candidatus Onthousia excrementipullorum]|uniref:Uncharacterized protein n=1 Tax=Candidatus Onthousia excrementipullorum TaxID=2840884 RepID=A0A9D1DU50_9FIRM|nr:hypothetical protein [Candidatus Onthousia excrementipullorum]
MQTEEKLEGIPVEEEKKIKKISTIIMIVIIVIGVLVTTDILLVSKAHVGPFLAIRTKVYDDGGTKEYYGLGYKVIKYNQVVGRRDTVIGSWGIKYNTNPETFTIRELAYSIINDNNNHVGEFIRLTGTISSKNNKNNTVTLKFTDDIDGKYDLTVKAELLSENIKDLNKDAPISLIGVIKSYDNKTLTIENVFAE